MNRYYKERFKRSKQDKMIGGVCGGFADKFYMDPLVIRLIFISMMLSPLPIAAVAFYILLWMLAPLNEVEIKTNLSDKYSDE